MTKEKQKFIRKWAGKGIGVNGLDRWDLERDLEQDLTSVIDSEIKKRIFPEAKPENKKDGWQLDYKFLQKLSDSTKNQEYHIGMEEIECVLIALRNQLLNEK